MNPITITQGGRVLAEQTFGCLRLPGSEVWIIREAHPAPGPATWAQRNGWTVKVNIIAVVNGWLVVRRPNGHLWGIVWQDGVYCSNWLRNARGNCTVRLSKGIYVDGGDGFSQSGHVLVNSVLDVPAIHLRKWWRSLTGKSSAAP